MLKSYVEWMQNNNSRRLEQKEKIQLRKCAPDAGGGLSEPDPAEGKAFRPEGASSGNGGSGRHTDYDGRPIVLQAICQGLSNAEIGEQQNLKITTVKSHIYNIYEKSWV